METALRNSALKSSPINLDELSERCLGRMDLLERLLASFDDYLSPQVDELVRAVETRNDSAIKSLAHRLKGAALTVAARDLSRSAEKLESAASGDSDSDRDQCLKLVLHECERLGAAVQAQLRRC
jgi:HPt (histidine-containing phosphotransfer) domain-containing protein